MLWLSCGKVRWQLAVAKVIPWTPSDQMFFTAFLGNLWLITKHVFRFTMQNLIDYLVGHCLPLRQFPCPDFFWYFVMVIAGTSAMKGFMTFPNLKENFLRKELVSTWMGRQTCLGSCTEDTCAKEGTLRKGQSAALGKLHVRSVQIYVLRQGPESKPWNATRC